MNYYNKAEAYRKQPSAVVPRKVEKYKKQTSPIPKRINLVHSKQADEFYINKEDKRLFFGPPEGINFNSMLEAYNRINKFGI